MSSVLHCLGESLLNPAKSSLGFFWRAEEASSSCTCVGLQNAGSQASPGCSSPHTPLPSNHLCASSYLPTHSSWECSTWKATSALLAFEWAGGFRAMPHGQMPNRCVWMSSVWVNKYFISSTHRMHTASGLSLLCNERQTAKILEIMKSEVDLNIFSLTLYSSKFCLYRFCRLLDKNGAHK